MIKAKSAYTFWLVIFNDFPKVSRNTLGKKIDQYFLELLENIFIAIYLAPEPKIRQLTLASGKLDSLKFLLQLAWENKCVVLEKFSTLSEQLNEIGRQIGGWKRGLESKTPVVDGRNS